MRVPGIIVAVCGLAALSGAGGPGEARAEQPWWPAEVEKALERAGENRGQLVQALSQVPPEQRPGMAFLVMHMPARDSRALTTAFLLENAALAYQARREAPWGQQLPEPVFLNDVLPYANLDEARDPWRKELYDLCRPLVKDSKTPGEAARMLNASIFPKLKVRYSTERKKACQSPKESIASGKASCSGLSILLVDACRSVGVPARVVGTPMWANLRGNHTWVEVWDNGWHFTGAAEPDPQGLDRAWFVGDAAEAKADSRQHAIWAASFQKTAETFPLVWAPGNREVWAENVTVRYARPKESPPTAGVVKVSVRVRGPGGPRVAVPVRVVDLLEPGKAVAGESRGDASDANDLLTFDLAAGREYVVRVGRSPVVEKRVRVGSGERPVVDVEVSPRRGAAPWTADQRAALEKAARAYFSAPAEKQKVWTFDAALDRLLAAHEDEARLVVWQAYREAPIHAETKKDFDGNEVRCPGHVAPYTVKQVGQRPAAGWPLFIAMHGGGGAPKAVNDSQWKVMQIYYKDQPSVTGYKYLALRAPNDAWNGFYEDSVLPLFVNLVRQMLLFGDVDPDRVHLMGYSHGGYGAFFVGPKLADRFASVHASAAAPTDGTISPATLRHTRFTFMIGEKDTAYGRLPRCRAFDEAVRQVQVKNPGEYPAAMEDKEGFGHGGLPDRDKILAMYPFVRPAAPRRVSWELTDGVVGQFFWLAVDRPARDQAVDAAVEGNTVRVTTRNVRDFSLGLDSRLVAPDRPVRVIVDGRESEVKLTPSLRTLCVSVQERGDPALAYTGRVSLTGGGTGK